MASELISALLDGECSAGEVRELLAFPDPSALMQQWSRMNLVHEVLAGKAMQPPHDCADADSFCAGVMANLGEMAPLEGVKALPVSANRLPDHPKVVSLPIRKLDAAPLRTRRSRPLIGWAAAASVAMIALASGRVWIGNGALPWASSASAVASDDAVSKLQAGSNSNIGSNRGDMVPVSTQDFTTSSQEPTETRWAQLNPEAARELSGYMIEHNNSRAEQGMNGELGYARIAAHNVDYRSVSESR
jgi:hypothetical protein